MELTNIFAELQANPNSIAAYRKLIECYKGTEYADAFAYLIKVKFEDGHHDTDHHQK